MILALLLVGAWTPSVIDAENAFSRDAQRLGQWTAFARYADRDAVMFTPQAAWARDYLKGRKNPPRSVHWWPTHSFVSCDGRTAVNTGPWVGSDGVHHGYFTTVWQAANGRWRWVYDGGDGLAGPVPPRTRPQVHRASCAGRPPGPPVIPPQPLTPKQARTTPDDSGRGTSADKSVGWDWKVDKKGARTFRTYQWNGDHYAQVLFNDVKAQ
ncbi:MAG: hypothetical protein ABIW33_03140 [Sphingomicrobium sp.]